MWRAGAQVSREPPPPIPGGYVMSDKVYFTGASETFENGDRLEHGTQGEVVGPAIPASCTPSAFSSARCCERAPR